ncbi:AI-2E family transporter [Streptomyces sp. CT34]|uniref:AI-2E family transporter n=1 Tax=Streptomyces sp. CT34 TaxID=1553907 RepID=UPI00099E14F4|nr:AI-2E family transporter [Streptomyces sp. CT34]
MRNRSRRQREPRSGDHGTAAPRRGPGTWRGDRARGRGVRGARPPGGRTVRRSTEAAGVPAALRVAAAYAWRLLVVGAAVYVVFVTLGRFHLVTLAVFLALVLTALLEPLTNALTRWMPRAAAVTTGLLLSVVLLFGVLSLIGANVAVEWPGLREVFSGGLTRIERWLQGPPFHLRPGALSHLQSWVSRFVASNRANLIGTAVSGVGRLAEVLTVGALALFCSIFFLHSGTRMWQWFGGRLPERRRHAVRTAGRTAWTTFTGYTRGIVIIAATNAVLVGLALFVLRVPLVLPLAVLEFFAAFIPLVGSPVALAVAAVVALASRGPLVAMLVVLLIVVIGQLEGHVLHPLVMSRAVRLHPVVVALAVVCGGVTAGVLGAVVAVPLVSVVWSVYGALSLRPLPPAV